VKPGQRVRVTGIPYEGYVGVITDVDPEESTLSEWPIWVHLEGKTHALGFSRHEVMDANVVGTEANLWDNGDVKAAPAGNRGLTTSPAKES
jgi:hypothetical protein